MKLLNKGKSDGNLGLNSNHLINGGNKLYVLVSLLFNAMIVHVIVALILAAEL